MKKQEKKLLALFIGIFFLILISIYIFWGGSPNGQQNSKFYKNTVINTKGVTKNIGMARRKIDGVYVQEHEANVFPVAVIIENLLESRPPASLAKANLVFEAPVEGGITRFLAIVASKDNFKKIGPVRSARPYFLDWASDFNSLLLHVGGSPEALRKIKKFSLFDLDQFYDYEYFWRDSDRAAPHNVYSSSELIARAIRDKHLSEFPPDYESWKYKNDKALDLRGEIENVLVDFSTPAYKVNWRYDIDSNSYIRYTNNELYEDERFGFIEAKNIIVMFTDIDIIDEYSRRKIKTIGSGDAYIFMDGYIYNDIIWKKPARSERLRFYQDNKEISLNAGTTWIEVIDDKNKVDYFIVDKDG